MQTVETKPPQLAHWPTCPDRISNQARAAFERDGFVAFENALSAEEVQEARAALSELVLGVARNAQSKRFGDVWKPGVGAFGVQFEKGWAPDAIASASSEDVELRVRKLMWFVDEHPHLQRLARAHARVQVFAEQLLGEAATLFQDMALVKPPRIGSEKPWHQDNAYFSVAPLRAVCGVWIALDEATPENGCMHMMRGGHKLGALRHHHTFDCEIVSDRVSQARGQGLEVVPVPLRPGGALFFAGMVPHQTPPNASDQRRRALQFHYRTVSSDILPTDKYFGLFAEPDGTAASCAAAIKRGV